MQRVRYIEFSKFREERHNLSLLEEGMHIPFPIRRIFYIYDIPGGETRGGHANRANTEVVIALSGSFDIHLSDGRETRSFTLNRSNIGLLVPPGLWVVMDNFTTGTVVLCLCSTPYDEKDYIRDLATFQQECACGLLNNPTPLPSR